MLRIFGRGYNKRAARNLICRPFLHLIIRRQMKEDQTGKTYSEHREDKTRITCFHNNEEVEMATRVWSRMQWSRFYQNGILDCFQDGLNIWMCSKVTLKCNDTSWNQRATLTVVWTSHLIFMTCGTLLIELPSYMCKGYWRYKL